MQKWKVFMRIDMRGGKACRSLIVFIQGADLEELGFIAKGKSHEGRPAYKPEILTKLYLYGYLNGIRSSRKLQKECERNIELWWLLSLQKPRYKTIADFRKNNALGFGNLFIYFRGFCMEQGLYGRKHVAIDGSKFRAQNSKKRNYKARKIKQHLDYISIFKTCPYVEQCVSEGNCNGHKGRYIDRYLNDHTVELNRVNVNNNRALFKKR